MAVISEQASAKRTERSIKLDPTTRMKSFRLASTINRTPNISQKEEQSEVDKNITNQVSCELAIGSAYLDIIPHLPSSSRREPSQQLEHCPIQTSPHPHHQQEFTRNDCTQTNTHLPPAGAVCSTQPRYPAMLVVGTNKPLHLPKNAWLRPLPDVHQLDGTSAPWQGQPCPGTLQDLGSAESASTHLYTKVSVDRRAAVRDICDSHPGGSGDGGGGAIGANGGDNDGEANDEDDEDNSNDNDDSEKDAIELPTTRHSDASDDCKAKAVRHRTQTGNSRR